MKKMPKQKSDFSKGNLRYKKLAKKVLAAVPPEESVRWWFLSNNSGRAQMAAAGAMSLLFTKEMAWAVTDRAVYSIPLKGMSVFSSSIKEDEIGRIPLDEVEASFDTKANKVTVNDVTMSIFAGHDFEALHFAHAAGADLPDWYIPAPPG